MSQVLRSEITFQRENLPGTLHLRVASSLDRTPGVTAGVFRAFAPHREVAAFLGKLSVLGAITLYDGNLGGSKVVLAGYRVVDAYPSQFDSDGQPVEWELFFADNRRVFAKPLGGEIAVGEINRAPINRLTKKDASGREVVEAEDLIALCLASMGVTPVGGVPTIPASRSKYFSTDLKWDGAWAPGELEELLKTYGLVFVPRMDGRFALGILGDSPWPNPPGPYVVTPLPAAGRTTDVVAFRSTPQPKLETMNLIPEPDVGFEWVLPEIDDDGRASYKPVNEVTWLRGIPGYPGPGTAIKALGEFFSQVPLRWRAVLKTDLYRLARVPRSLLGDGISPLNQVYDVYGPIGPPILIADAAVLDTATAMWSMPGEVGIQVGQIVADPSGAILTLKAQAFKLRDGITTAEDVTIWSDAAELVAGDCYLRVTREVADERGKLEYFSAGFRRYAEDAILQLSDEQLAEVSPSLAVSAPSLLYVSVQPEGTDPEGDSIDNEEELLAEARALAEVILGRRGDAAEFVMPGYWPVELSGSVSSVSYTQTPPETRYTVGSHYRPAQGKAGTGGAAGVGHTPSRSTDQAKAAAGSVASSPYSRVLADAPRATSAGSSPGTFVQLASREVGREKYRGSIIALKDTSSPSTDAFADLGPSPGESVLLVNIGGRSIGPTHTLALESIVGPVTFVGSIDTPPAEGSPQGTPRDRRRVCYIATDWTPFRQFRTREQGDNLILEGSHAAQPLQDSDWETILTFDLCPPPEGA